MIAFSVPTGYKVVGTIYYNTGTGNSLFVYDYGYNWQPCGSTSEPEIIAWAAKDAEESKPEPPLEVERSYETRSIEWAQRMPSSPVARRRFLIHGRARFK